MQNATLTNREALEWPPVQRAQHGTHKVAGTQKAAGTHKAAQIREKAGMRLVPLQKQVHGK